MRSNDCSIGSHSEGTAVLQALYTSLLTAEHTSVVHQLDAYLARIATTTPVRINTLSHSCSNLLSNYNYSSFSSPQSTVDIVAVRIHDDFPGDVGVFCIFLLNYVCLDPGQAMFMPANEPHAYLLGGHSHFSKKQNNKKTNLHEYSSCFRLCGVHGMQ